MNRNLPENLQIQYNFLMQAAKLYLWFQILQFKIQIRLATSRPHEFQGRILYVF